MKKIKSVNPVVLTVTANPSLDVVIDYAVAQNHFTRVKSRYEMAGGKGINVARALSYFHAPVVMTGFLGGATGLKMRRILKKENFCASFVDSRRQTRTNYFLYFKKKLVHSLPGESPVITKKKAEMFWGRYKKILPKAWALAASGSSPLGLSKDFYAKLIRAAKIKNLFTALDTHGDLLREGIKANPHFIKPNEEECCEFLGCRLDTTKQQMKALRSFYALGIGKIIISLGDKGSVAFDGRNAWKVDSLPAGGPYPTGCGDTMVGCFLYGQSQAMPFEDCYRIAVAGSVANTFSVVPGEIKESAFKRAYQSVKIKKIP